MKASSPSSQLSRRQVGSPLLLPKRFDVAVFPLANAVLFPGTSLPLHIFEDRYAQMLRDIQARGYPLAVSLVVPCNETEFILNTICGAGQVQIFREYEDGRSDILVHGRQRVKLCEFVQQKPYFIMEAESIEPEPLAPPSANELKILTEFRALAKTWAFINPDVPSQTASALEQFGRLGDLCDYFVFNFLKKAPDKQIYLNCSNPMDRAEMLGRFLETDLIRLTRKVSKNVAVMRRAMILH